GHTHLWEFRALANGRMGVEIDDGGTNYVAMDSNSIINNGVFHHIALVRQGTTASLYVDGVLDRTQSTAAITDISTTTPMFAGWGPCVGVDGTNYYSGRLDELAIYSRALSASEISSIFNMGSALPNAGGGIVVSAGASGNLIGSANGAGNVISGNTGTGITITDSGTTGNLVKGNYIGTNVAGTAALGNSSSG